MALRLSPILFNRLSPIPFLSLNGASTLSTLPLNFLPVFVFLRVHNRWSKIIVCRRVLVWDSGRESELANFYRLQLRVRLQPKRPTPVDSNSGFDSDSAALRAAAVGAKRGRHLIEAEANLQLFCEILYAMLPVLRCSLHGVPTIDEQPFTDP